MISFQDFATTMGYVFLFAAILGGFDALWVYIGQKLVAWIKARIT
jgi:hypothetical protein